MIYVGNECQDVSGKITGNDAAGNVYEDWTDLNGNTLVIVQVSDTALGSRGFELEFKCREQSPRAISRNQDLCNQIDCYDGNNGGCSHHCTRFHFYILTLGPQPN